MISFALQSSFANYALQRWNPGLMEERMNPGPGVKKWDKLMVALFVLGLLSILVVAGIDHRYAWTDPLGVTGPALLLNFIGGSVVMWASTINPFFSSVVRIQSDRGHEVISTGPYAMVRHPGYLGWLIQWGSVPFLLSALWALVPFVIWVVFVVIRTTLEDKALQDELPGYLEYQRKVRFRLIPGIW